MIGQMQTSQAKPLTVTPQSQGAIQRKCACGSHAHGGECEECKQKRAGRLQRAAIHPSPEHEVPPIVHEVLRSPGQPLDPGTRAFMEPRFGHDFSNVRVHSDAKAAESAQAVHAIAYTVGNHIALGAERHHPETTQGRQLIAHELAHIVQQSQGAAGNRPENASYLETEARGAASAVATQGILPSVTHETAPMLQRKDGAAQPAPPQPTAPTAEQQRIIETARRAAAIRCQIAMFRVSGIVPPGPAGRVDPATVSRMRARSLARVMFEWANPNMEQISEIIQSMVNKLSPSLRVMIAPTNDPECGMRAGYVVGLRPPIILCPTFFNDDTPEQRIRTLIHEAAHLAGIGSGSLGESYCVDFDCTTSCGGFEAADSWAHFVHCLSGQPADQPMTIQGSAPAGPQGGGQRSGPR